MVIGSRNHCPADARNTLGWSISTLLALSHNPSAPAAVAVRIMVPKLPGSCRVSSAIPKLIVCPGEMWAFDRLAVATTPSGFTVVAIDCKTASVTNSTRCDWWVSWSQRYGWFCCHASVQQTVISGSPVANASSSRWVPSSRNSCCSRRSFAWCSFRNCLTRGFCKLVSMRRS